MKTFLAEVVDDILQRKLELKNLTLVFPSQRANIFTKELFKNKLSSASHLPKIVSIERFIQEVADFQLIDQTQLLFEFYDVYKNQNKDKNISSFSEFISWASIMLQDFNEIDANLINTNDFFHNLSDLKKLTTWFNSNETTDITKNYLNLFNQLKDYYNALTTKLKNLKFGYQGFIYREATDNLEYYIQNNTNTKLIFIGFNALNKAEEVIIQELLENGLADIYWDYNDGLNQSNAGKFINNYRNNWKYYKTNTFKSFGFENRNQNIYIYGAPKNTTQIKHCSILLENLNCSSNTAYVLANESLLPIALNSIPKNVQSVNITMGFPLNEVPIVTLFEKIFKIHSSNTNNNIYHADLLDLINDPFLNKIENQYFINIKKVLSEFNQVYFTVENLKEITKNKQLKPIHWFFDLLQPPLSVNELIGKCLELINELKFTCRGLEIEYLFAIQKVFNQLELLNKKYQYITDVKTLNVLYKKLVKLEKIPFQGEPLSGLQLLGMLETRVLDFKNVIITSVNEGILPMGKSNNSFIPFDMKMHYGLPTFNDKDAIFAYHFYRLIQRAKNVFLYYNTETDGYGSGEKSRFLTQLLLANNNIEHTIVSPQVNASEEQVLEIKKTPEIIAKLKTIFSTGISASALSTYIYNPIEFYQRYVLEINEENEIEETVATNTMGSIIHEVLENLYKPYVNTLLTTNICNIMLKQVEKQLAIAFHKYYKNGDYTSGKNKLIYEVCKNYINLFIKNEINHIVAGNRIVVLDVEKKYFAEVDGFDFPVKIKGFIDRVDSFNNHIRIIDYKTGNVTASQLKINDFSVIPTDYKYTKALQVMLYAYLFSKTIEQIKPMEAGIISFKNLKADFIKMNFASKRNDSENTITQDILDLFIEEIKLLISEMCNPEIPFIENTNKPF